MEPEQHDKTKQDMMARLEALLFVQGSPITITKITSLLNLKEDVVREYVEELTQEYISRPQSGLAVVVNGDSVALRTKPELSALVETLAKEDIKEDLTPAALETLSLIAYFAPVSRAEIDYIRGVNSAYIIRTLLMRGLIERQSDKNRYVYTPSIAMLSHMGIGTVQELPEYEKYQNLKKELYASEEQETNSVTTSQEQSTV